MKKILVSSFLLAAFSATAAEFDLDAIFEPTDVAVQPSCACNGLCVMPDGRIRHYGQQSSRGKVVRTYIETADEGLSWKTFVRDAKDRGAGVKCPWGDYTLYIEDLNKLYKGHYVRHLLPMRSRKRWIAALVDCTCVNGECYHAAVAYSDDDGKSWKYVKVPVTPGVERLAPGDRKPHWFNNGCEPSVVELKDGTLLMALRTSGPNAAFSRSTDGGATWEVPKPDPRFYQANTMPFLLRLKDGRIIFFWNNTQMLPTRDLSEAPELNGGEKDGHWEAVFTNRDALHAAISDDEGRTWKGFRELVLNRIRNNADFRELGNEPAQELDKSVHQSQAIELSNGKVMLAYGQNSSARGILVFDPNWLLEKKLHEDFRRGLGKLSNHLYLRSHWGGARGWAGHCCWNRLPGAVLVRNPDLPLTNRGEVLRVCRIRDERLYCDRQGAVWNFPALAKGMVSVNCRIAGEGFRMSVLDHWINPSDETNPQLSPVSVEITEKEVPKGGGQLKWWHDVTVKFDCAKGEAVLLVDNKELRTVKFNREAPAGMSYLHIQTLAEGADPLGSDFRCFHAE